MPYNSPPSAAINQPKMNKRKAQKIAEHITNQQLADMLEAARKGITDWEERSAVNKGITKGVAWNILGQKFDPSKQYHQLAKVNMIWEFGDFLPAELMPEAPAKPPRPKPQHQPPIFLTQDEQG